MYAPNRGADFSENDDVDRSELLLIAMAERGITVSTVPLPESRMPESSPPEIPRIGTSDWSAGLLQRESTVQAVMSPSL